MNIEKLRAEKAATALDLAEKLTDAIKRGHVLDVALVTLDAEDRIDVYRTVDFVGPGALGALGMLAADVTEALRAETGSVVYHGAPPKAGRSH